MDLEIKDETAITENIRSAWTHVIDLNYFTNPVSITYLWPVWFLGLYQLRSTIINIDWVDRILEMLLSILKYSSISLQTAASKITMKLNETKLFFNKNFITYKKVDFITSLFE